jgi:hypothetical protein
MHFMTANTRWAREVAEEKFHSLSDTSADGAWRLVVFKMECRSSLRSFPFYGLGVLSCVSPLLAHHRQRVPCPRGCELLPSAMLGWSESSPCFEQRYLLPQSWC